MPTSTTITVGGSVSVQLNAGSSLHVFGSGSAQIGSPRPVGSRGDLIILSSGESVIGPLDVASTVNIVAGANGASYHVLTPGSSDADQFNPTQVAGLQALVSGAGIPPSMRRILALGTSITNKWGDSGVAGSTRITKGDSYLFWLSVSLRGGVASIINAGVSGNTSTQMLARYQTDVVPQYANFDTLILEPGPNDYPGGLSAATIESNISTMVSAALTAGKQVIVLTPTLTEFSSSAQNAVQQEVRQWLLQTYGAMANVLVIDVAPLLTDPLTGTPLSSLYAPTSFEATRVHPSMGGAQVMGRAIADAIPLKPAAALVQSLGARDHFEYLPNARLQGSNASSARNFYAGAGVTVTGGPDSAAIAITNGSFTSVTIAPATGSGADIRTITAGTRITAVSAGAARSRIQLRVGSGDTAIGGTQWGRWDVGALANATYAFGDHATIAGSPAGILTCIVPGATGTTSVVAPSTYGETVTVGAATFLWQRNPAAGDVYIPEIEYEIESQSGGLAIWGWTQLYRTLDGSVGERWGDCQFGMVDESVSISQGNPALWMPRRGVMRGLPITLVNPGVAVRHVLTDVHLMLDTGASATVRFDRVSLRRQ